MCLGDQVFEKDAKQLKKLFITSFPLRASIYLRIHEKRTSSYRNGRVGKVSSRRRTHPESTFRT